MAVLENYYVSVRQDLHRADTHDQERGRAPRAVPITVRQLEAVVRISESCARMRLSAVATEDDVQQAIQLFTVSTLEAAKMNELQIEGGDSEEARSCEEAIRTRVAIGAKHSKAQLLKDLAAVGYDERGVLRALHALIKQGVLEQLQQGKQLKRTRS